MRSPATYAQLDIGANYHQPEGRNLDYGDNITDGLVKKTYLAADNWQKTLFYYLT